MKLTLIFFLLLSINLGMSNGSYYELLEVSETATQQEIRQAYKKLAVKYHPDKNPNESDQLKFLEISEAYETLKNPWKRRSYDYSGQSQSSSQNNQDLLYNGLYKHDPYVVTITPEEFDSFLSSGFHFVNFYSPFCPPCQKLVKHWKALAEAYHGIVKFGAVNCKYHSSFCYNVKRINSYPSLFFYPEGSSGSYIFYPGGRSYDEISTFLTSQLSARAPLATTARLTISPALYVLKRDRFSEEALVRIRYRLKDILPVVLLSSSATSKWGDEVTCVISLSQNIELTFDNEMDVMSAVEQHLPNFTNVTQEMFTKIRSDLRMKAVSPWIFYMTDGPLDRLTLHRVNHTLKNVHIGVIDCTMEGALCASLHWSSPHWGVLHGGGAYSDVTDPTQLTHRVSLHNVHTLSHTEVHRIVHDGDTQEWIMLTVPEWSKQNHDQLVTRLAQHFHDMQVGLWRCPRGNKDCNNRIQVRIQKKNYSNPGPADFQKIVEFINLIRDTPHLDLDEDKVLEVMQGTKDQTWVLVMTSASDPHADTLVHQWRLAAKKLTSFNELKIGVLRCTSNSGLCSNIRNSVVRYYPPKSTFTQAVSAAELSSWGYMCEWVLTRLVPVDYMSFNSFTKQVLSDQLHSGSSRPWLIYFHSPRCHSCYINYADFVIAGQRLKPAVRIAKVNCLVERDLCHREQIHAYPSLRLYLSSRHRSFMIHSIQLGDHDTLVERIKRLIVGYDKSLLNGLEGYSHIAHDEF